MGGSGRLTLILVVLNQSPNTRARSTEARGVGGDETGPSRLCFESVDDTLGLRQRDG